jgi:hypothetical protein
MIRKGVKLLGDIQWVFARSDRWGIHGMDGLRRVVPLDTRIVPHALLKAG